MDNYFNFTKDTREWTGTDIVFDISRAGDKTEVRLTHHGLVPEYECYEACKDGWSTYINGSLHDLIAKGKGQPNLGEPLTDHERELVLKNLIGKIVQRSHHDDHVLSLGHRRGRRPAGLRRDRRHVFAAGVPAADLAGYRLVGHRRIERHDHRLSGHGLRQHGLGQPVRPLGPRLVVVDRVGDAGREPVRWRARPHRCSQFQLVFGLLVGGARRAIFAPMMACVTGWFDTHRSLAVSLVSAGMGMAPMTMSPLAAWLVSAYDWRTSLLIIALIVAAVMIPAALLVRRAAGARSRGCRASADAGRNPT